jgi:hypothetical protein
MTDDGKSYSRFDIDATIKKAEEAGVKADFVTKLKQKAIDCKTDKTGLSHQRDIDMAKELATTLAKPC